MKKYLLLFLLLPCVAFAQHGVATTAKKLQVALPDSTEIPTDYFQPDGTPIRAIYGFSSWVQASDDSVKLGVLPADALILEVKLWVKEGFNATGDDYIKVGHSDNQDAYIVETDVSTTGIKTNGNAADGSRIGKSGDNVRVVWAYYTATGSIPTTGKALITIIWTKVDVSP